MSSVKPGEASVKSTEKWRAVETALTQIERQFGKGSIMKLGGQNQIFASRFNAANNTWIPEGQDRAPQNLVPSLNIHTNQDAENPSVAGGSAGDATKPGPWVSWQVRPSSCIPNSPAPPLPISC